MRTITIRNVPPDLERALRLEQRERGTSLNQTVLDLLGRGLGVVPGAKYENGLRAMAATWSRTDLEEFQKATVFFAQIDEDLWL